MRQQLKNKQFEYCRIRPLEHMLFTIYCILFSNLVVKLGILIDIHITREKILSGLESGCPNTNHVVDSESPHRYNHQDIMNHFALWNTPPLEGSVGRKGAVRDGTISTTGSGSVGGVISRRYVYISSVLSSSF